MNRYRLFTAIFLIIFFGGGGIHVFRERQSRAGELQKETAALPSVLKGAAAFSPKQDNPPHYKGYTASTLTQENLDGVAFVTIDITPDIRGYAGPIKALVGVDIDGRIRKVHILSHSETPSYVLELDTFLQQFFHLTVRDAFRLGEDLDGISRASITSEAIARSVEQGLKKIGADVLHLETAEITEDPAPFPFDEIFIPVFLFALASASILIPSMMLRRASLLGGFLYFGLIKGTMVSTVQIVNLCLGKLPTFDQNPLWYMLVGLVLLTTPLLGMVFCGSLCPFAAIQETLYKLVHPSVKIKTQTLSHPVDHRARSLKYIILMVVLMISITLGNANAASIEPFLSLFAWKATPIGWILLIATLVAGMIHFRFWCCYLCPAGAGMGLLAHLSPFQIRLGEKCTHCELCAKVCPTMAIHMDQSTKLPVIDYPECILCGQCLRQCPKATLNLRSTPHE